MRNTKLFDKLHSLLKQLPGVGTRQAERYVYFLLEQSPGWRRDFADLIQNMGLHMHQCSESFQWFYDEDPYATLSPIARNPERNRTQRMIVIKDLDITAIESANIYKGQYFVLGGLLPLVRDSMSEEAIRLRQLQKQIELDATEGQLEEIIIAFPLHTEGEHTRHYVTEQLSDLAEKYHFKVVTLGRGLSTGTELEYIDADTFSSAFNGRRSE